jgi:hypothetical protein
LFRRGVRRDPQRMGCASAKIQIAAAISSTIPATVTCARIFRSP